MKKPIIFMLAAALVGALLFSAMGCSRTGVLIGSGKLITEEKDFSDFTSIEAGAAFNIEIVQSGLYSVSITADDNLLEHIEVSKEGETLRLGVKPGSHIFTTLMAEITMPELYGIGLSGAANSTVHGFSSSHDFILDLSGASTVTGDITAGDAQFDLSGASIVALQGSASDLVIEASGASHVELAGFPVNNADVKLSEASSGTVNLDGTLDVNLSSASTLNYVGNPTMGTVNVTGASTLRKIE